MLIVFFFLFIFSFFYSVFYFKRMEEHPFILLLKIDMNKLFKFYWKKGNQMLIFQTPVILLILFFFFFFSLSHFFSFFILKGGRTPLFLAACQGHEQIVQLLLEKGNPNVDLPDQVLLLILSFLFLFLFLFFSFSFFYFFKKCKVWRNSSFYCC